MILDFSQITPDLPEVENIKRFFEKYKAEGRNPRTPENRQQFNNAMLAATGARYLVSRYGEDRRAMLVGSEIAREGRTLHMGIDIFSKDLEPVFAPCDGKIIRAAYEKQAHGYGHYIILRPNDKSLPHFFIGHLSKDLPELGAVRAGQHIAMLGDRHNAENGGWSRHLHLQMVWKLPVPPSTPDGYATPATFTKSSQNCPNPLQYFPHFPRWQITNDEN